MDNKPKYGNENKPEFDATKIYNCARDAYKSLDKKGSKSKRVLMSCFYAALDELGYSEDELASDIQKATKLATALYSSKYLGNKKYNPLLTDNPFYANFDKGNLTDKLYMHKAALGLGFSDVLNYIRQRGGIDENMMLQLAGKSKNDRIEEGILGYLESEVGEKDKYAKFCEVDHNIGKINLGQMSYEDLQNLAKRSVMGRTSYGDLENMVGVTARKYEPVSRQYSSGSYQK